MIISKAFASLCEINSKQIDGIAQTMVRAS